MLLKFSLSPRFEEACELTAIALEEKVYVGGTEYKCVKLRGLETEHEGGTWSRTMWWSDLVPGGFLRTEWDSICDVREVTVLEATEIITK